MGKFERPREPHRRSHGAGEARRLNCWECLKNLALAVRLCLEPILSMLASFGDLLRHRFDSFMDWIREQAGGRVAVRKRRVMSRDLKSVQFLKQGLSGFVYETTWSTWYGMERSGRYARKDFPGVDSKLFEDEAARLVDLDHPNLVKTYCWTVDKLGCSLVMEFVNDDLESVVRDRKAAMKRRSLQSQDPEIDVAPNPPFILVEAMYIMWHIAAAMEYLHSMKVAHGDLRPNNVMVDLDPGRMIVKVVDFGLIESKKRTTLVSKRAKFLQILEWKAPELCEELVTSLHVTSDEYPWTCTSENYDDFQKLQMADRYSFAILCTYIMGGKVSYPKSNLKDLQQKLLSGTLKPKLPSTCPRRLKTLIESCWSRITPEKRIDFPKFREGLEDIIQREETWGGRSLNHHEVGGILQRWVEEIQQMGGNKTLFYKMTTTMRYDAKNYRSLIALKPADKYLDAFTTRAKDLEIAFETVLLPSSESTKPSELARLNTEPSPSESHRPPTASLVQSEHAKSSLYWWRSVEERIERSKMHWIALADMVEDSDYEERLPEEHLEVFAALKEKYDDFFMDIDDIGLCVRDKFAEGGQAEMFHAHWLLQQDEIALKVFKSGTSFRDLQSQWPIDFLLKEARAHKQGQGNPRICHIFGGLLLKDGRFAFAMKKYRGDLRSLIDRRMSENGDGMPPFTMVVVKHIMMEIAEGMQMLHDGHVVHRDLKASNILIERHVQSLDQSDPEEDAFSCVVADFETNIGVLGTGYFRAPEILRACKDRSFSPELFTEKSDVYSFSMTCYEILTGRLPFQDHPPFDYALILDGGRPELPSHIDPAIVSLISRCWHHEPSQRPTFAEILDELKHMNLIE